MIELLVKAKNTHGNYLKGHITNIKELPCPWGKKECLPMFLRIQINAGMEQVRHLKSERLVRKHDVTQIGQDKIITIKNAPQLSKTDFEEVKSTLEREVPDSTKFTVQKNKLIFRSNSEIEKIKDLLCDLMETQYKVKRYRIKEAVIDDLIKVSKNSTVQISLEQLKQSTQDDKIEAIGIY